MRHSGDVINGGLICLSDAIVYFLRGFPAHKGKLLIKRHRNVITDGGSDHGDRTGSNHTALQKVYVFLGNQPYAKVGAGG
jgi:hypothetical protein